MGKKTGKTDVKKLKKDVAKLKKMDVKNYKYIYIPSGSNSTSVATATPSLFLLNGMASGTTELNRIGDKVRMISIECRGTIYRALSSATYPVVCRLMMIREKTALGSAVSLSQVLNSSTPSTYDVRNRTSRDASRFQILYDKTFQIGELVSSTGTANHYDSSQPSIVPFVIKKKLGFVTSYVRGDAGSIADIDTNSLYIALIADTGTANDVGWAMSSLITVDDN